LVLLALAFAALASRPFQAAGQAGAVTGSFTVNDVTVPLVHAYAHAEPGFFDKTSEDIHVLLSDTALSDADRADPFALIHLARDGEARMIEVVIDARGEAIAGSLYAKEFDGMVSAAGMHRFTRERLERTVIAGRLAVDGVQEFMRVRWRYEARFSAPIPRPPTPAETAAALEAPAAIVAAAHLAAIRDLRLDAFVATLTSISARDYAGSAGRARLQDVHDDMPADSRVVALVPQADGSVLATVEGHEDGVLVGHTLPLVQEAGAWKVSYPPRKE
jgi:hypothetical protein